jgi:hypothetical protein
VTERAVFGDFLRAAHGHLGSAAVLHRAAARGGDAREISQSLLRLVIVMGRYVQDVSTGPRQVPSEGEPVTGAWDRAGLRGRAAARRYRDPPASGAGGGQRARAAARRGVSVADRGA